MSKVFDFERSFWGKTQRDTKNKASDEEIEAKYDSKSERIVTETNREKLQNFFESLSRPNYMDPQPHYQRRKRWDDVRQSQLIESFLINIPIPPLFVYETKPNVYEVMDGQQRITAIKAFYSNELILKGLDRWPELNGRTYNKLPEKIRSGIDRRSISWITVLHESSESEEDAFAIKQLVFERLNTGGVKLSHQEIRNALYSSPFNSAIIELSKESGHRSAWGLPGYSIAEESYVPLDLQDNSFYMEMEDVEVILRFFALRHAEHYAYGMRGFLDLYMERASKLKKAEVEALKSIYIKTINLAHSVYKEVLFKPFNKKDSTWGNRPQKAYADAVLVALSEYVEQPEKVISCSSRIIEMTKQIFELDNRGVLTGRGNTKGDVIDRINLLRSVIGNALKS
jgi:hypothetical protein